ncbi:unnamed protein product [Chrysoparadoxa australica]
MWDPNSMAGSSQGRPFDQIRAEALWALRIMPEPTSPEELWKLHFKILYYDRFTDKAMKDLMAKESCWLHLSVYELRLWLMALLCQRSLPHLTLLPT